MATDPTAQPNPAALPLLGTINAPGAAQQAVTAAQLQSMRDYAAALMSQSMKQPDLRNPYNYSWSQGVGHIVEALVGGKLSREADVREQQQRAAQSDILSRSLGGAAAPPPPAAGGLPGARAESDAETPDASVAPATSAAVRNNNPGAQWPGPVAAKWGASGAQDLPGGQKIATFDDPVRGAAAQFDLLGSRYAGMPLAAAIAKWSGGNSAPEYTAAVARAAGLDPNAPLTPELLAGPQGVKLARAMARHEAGGAYPLSDEQWTSAQRLAFSGEPTPATAPVPMPGGAPALGRPTLPQDEIPQPIGAPTLPPDAQATVRALASTGGAGAPPASTPPGPPGQQFVQAAPPAMAGGAPPQEQVRQMAGALIRTGMEPPLAIRTATEAVQAHQGFLPTYQRDDYGNIWSQVVGQPPRIIQQGPGKVVTYDPGIPGVPHRRYIENLARDPQSGAWRLTQQPFDPGAGGTPPTPITAPAAPRAAPPGAPAAPSATPAYTPPLAAPGGAPAPAGAPPGAAVPAPLGAAHGARPQLPGPGASDQDWINYQNDLKIWEAGAKKAAEEGSAKNVEGLFKPINEARDRGGQKAQETLNVLDRMDEAYRQGGPDISGGPAGEFVLKAKQLGNQIFGGGDETWKGLSPSEVIRKSTAELALKAIKEASSRGGTQREFIAMLDNNPGINLSNTGSRYMIDILRQQEKQSQAVAQLANRMGPENAHQWQDALGAFYADPRNALRSPFTGKPLLGDTLKEDADRLRAAKTTERGYDTPPGALGIRPPPAYNAQDPQVQAAAQAEIARRAKQQVPGAAPGPQ